MAKAIIAKVEALAGCTAGLEIAQDWSKAVKYMVTYETGSVRYYDAEKAPKTVMAWIEANVEVVELEIEPVKQEVVPVEQAVEQVVEQVQKTPRRKIVNDSDIQILSYFWDLESLLLILIHAGLIGTVWILKGTVRTLPVIRAVITETAGVIQEIAGWFFEGADLIREAAVYVGTVL